MSSRLKEEIIRGLLADSQEKLPTSTMRRMGSTALNVFRSGRLILSGRKRRRDADGEDRDQDRDLKKVVKIITSIGRLKGIAMKMGQILSYIDIAMPDELRDALSVLQTHAQPMPFEKVRDLIAAELGPKGQALLDGMEEVPVSAASIGQVHRASLPDRTSVAVKVQYPDVAKAMEHDFGPASFGTRLASLFYPNARIDDLVKEAKNRFLEECDYIHEAHCQDMFAAIYSGHPILFVPAVHPEYCSRRVLTTSFVTGLEFDPFLKTDPSQETRNRIGEALFEFYIGSLFKHQIYNCDPHPGNYLFCDDGRVAMLDHGCTRQFEPRFVAKLANLTKAVHTDERNAVHRALVGLDMVREDKPYDYELIHGFLRSFYGPMLKDEVAAVDLSSAMDMREAMKKKRQLMRFSLPGEFLFLFRIRFGLLSVLSRLGARANWYRLEKRYIEEFARAHPILSE